MPVDVNRPGPWTHRNLTARGTRFHVALAGPEAPAGAGPLTLLVHGFPECWWTWRHVIPALAQAGHRVAALDLRGSGGSDRPPSGYDLVTLAQDLAAVVRSLGHERAVVVGAGLGGQIAWALPSLAPDLTTAIVPVGAPHPLALRSLRARALSGPALQYVSLRIPGLAERRLRSRSALEGLLRSWAGPHTRETVAEEAPYYAELLSRPGAAHSALEPGAPSNVLSAVLRCPRDHRSRARTEGLRPSASICLRSAEPRWIAISAASRRPTADRGTARLSASRAESGLSAMNADRARRTS